MDCNILDQPLSELGLKTRTHTTLTNAGVETVRELVCFPTDKLVAPFIGQRSVSDIIQSLAEFDLYLGMLDQDNKTSRDRFVDLFERLVIAVEHIEKRMR